MKKSEEDHIKEYGGVRFHKSLVLANMEVRKDRRLIGLDKIRYEIAFTAALKATGYETSLTLSKRCGAPARQIEEIAQEVLRKAVAAVDAC